MFALLILFLVMLAAVLFLLAAFNVGSPKLNLFHGGWAALAFALLVWLWPKLT